MNLALGAGLALMLSTSAAAQEPTYPQIVLGGRLQTQFYAFDNENLAKTGSSSNFFIRRARIQVNAKLRENVSLVIQPSFEGGRGTGVRLRDAYIDVRLTPASSRTAFTIRTGAEKKPFGRYELLSSNNLPSLERNAGRGLLPVASNNLFETAGYIATDLGASLILGHKLAEGRYLTVQAGGYNGQGESINDVNGSKSLGVQATADVTKKLALGLAFFSHDGIVALTPTVSDSSFRNQAVGLQAQWGKPGDKGLFVVADFMAGEDFTKDLHTMKGVSVVAAYHARTTTSKLFAVEPVVRFDWADPDAAVAANASTLVSAGGNLYLTAKAQLRFMFETQNPQATAGKTISGIRTAMTMNF
jgi:hypothetical protein